MQDIQDAHLFLFHCRCYLMSVLVCIITAGRLELLSLDPACIRAADSELPLWPGWKLTLLRCKALDDITALWEFSTLPFNLEGKKNKQTKK